MFGLSLGQTLFGLLAVFVLSRLKTWIDRYRFKRAHGCRPPKRIPQSERLLGWAHYSENVIHAANRESLERTVRNTREIAPTFSFVLLGLGLVLTCEPENVKSVLSTNFKDYNLGRREKAFRPLLGSGIFTTDGSRWEHSRALVRPNFAKQQVADLSTFETHIQHMLALIPTNGDTIDLQVLFFKLTFDSATDFLFGESVDILRSPEGSEQQLFATAFDFAQSQLRERTAMGPFLFLWRNKEFDTACKRVHAFVDRFVFKALEYRKMEQNEKNEKNIDTAEQGRQKYVFLHELAKATDDPKQLRDELLNILLAGRDTTAGLLSNAFSELARRPDIWAKLQAEVETLNGELPDYDSLKNLKYLRNFLNESLRLYPSVPVNARYAERDTTLPRGGGSDGLSPVFVAKGSVVVYSVYSMHRRLDLYGPDADEFKPERWDTLRPGWEYLPFNGGPRICVGQTLALTEAGYTIVRMCQAFKKIENRDSGPWVEGLGLTLCSGNGTKVSLGPR